MLNIRFLIAIVVLHLIFLTMYYPNTQYKDTPPPTKTADSLKTLVVALVQNNEEFIGSVKVTKQPASDIAAISVVNNASGDDSVGAIEYKMVAERKGGKWVITKSKAHWKCLRDLFFSSFWTTSSCP